MDFATTKIICLTILGIIILGNVFLLYFTADTITCENLVCTFTNHRNPEHTFINTFCIEIPKEIDNNKYIVAQ